MIKPTVSEISVKDFKNAPSKRVLSKSLVAFCAISQLGFGFNFGFVLSNGRFKTATRFMTAAVGCIMILALILSFTLQVVGRNSHVVYFIQYIPCFVILLAAKYTLYDFLTDLVVKNEKSPTESKNDAVGLFLWTYTSLLFAVKFATAIVYCSLTVCIDSRWSILDIGIHVPMIGLDIMPIANFIMFFHVYARMRDLRIKYECQEINLKQLQISYKEVADGLRKFRHNYDAIFVCGFLTESSKWMLIIWNHLTLVKSSRSWWLHGSSYIWAFLNTVQICVPAVFAEMISVQTDAMKMKLHDKLLIENDEAKASDLQCLLRYVEARPLLHKAWRLVPVDLRLPVTMLSICTTYLIVIIQFTHLFD